MTSSPFLAVRRVGYAYARGLGSPVLRNISLEIGQEEYLLLAGPSGSGKSTLCRTFNGLIPHFYGGTLAGEVVVDGLSVAQQSVAALFDRVGMVFQNPEAQLFNRTVRREIAFGLESQGLAREKIAARIDATAEELGIVPLLDRHPQALSGGERHLAAIAAILALHPALLVLDEPYASLDSANARRIRRALKGIHAEGTGVIVCEHRLEVAAEGASRLAVLEGGRLVQDGAVSALTPAELVGWGLEPPGGVPALGDLTPLRLPEAAANHGAEGVPLLEVDGLCASRNSHRILHDVGLTLRAGECVALLGPNGAGKTTLLRHLNGLSRPSAGCVRLRGEDIRRKRTSELARQIGMAFQNPDNQFFRLSVREEIAAGPLALGCHDPTWIAQLVSLFGLEDNLERAPYRLSGGEKRRVAFASALAANPSILVLDEPTAGQDLFFQQRLRWLMSSLREQGRAVLLATHDLRFAAACADRWVLLAEGRVVADGPPSRMLTDPSAMGAIGVTPEEVSGLLGLRGEEGRE